LNKMEAHSLELSEFDNNDITSSTYLSNIIITQESLDTVPAIFQSKRKERKSFVWYPENGEEYQEQGKWRWRCHRCSNIKDAATFSDTSTRNMIWHLKQVHGITKDNPDGLSNQEKSRIHNVFNNTLPQIIFNQDIFKQLLIRWITINNISFRQIEDPTFRDLLAYLSACTASFIVLNKALPSSGDTIRNWILCAFYNARTSLIQQFQQYNNIVHFSFDLWTSPNHRAFLGVVGQWVDTTGNLKAALLGLRRFKGSHSGENIATHFWEIIQDFKLTKQIGYFTLDNASNNDTAMKIIQDYHTAIGLSFNPIKRRLRCF